MSRLNTGLAALAALSMAVAACAQSEDAEGAPSQVRIGYQISTNGAVILKHNGWLEEALGIPVEWQQFDSGADINRAVASGAIDIGLAGSSPVATGIAAGLTYRVAWIYGVIGDSEALVAKPDRGIETLSDLRGKKVGTPFGSSAHFVLLKSLEGVGIATSELEIFDLQPDDIAAAWFRGDIDAAYLWAPALSRLKEDGGQVVQSSAVLAETGPFSGDLGVVRAAFADRYPDVVAEWVRQEDRAVHYFRDNPDQAVADVAEEFSIPVESARTQMMGNLWLDASEQTGDRYFGTSDAPGQLANELLETVRFLRAQGLIGGEPTEELVRGAVDGGFAAEAAQHGG